MKKIITILISLALASTGFANLIQNGDFEAGNTGFVTDYSYNGNHLPTDPEWVKEQEYTVYTNPILVHKLWTDYVDHTSGTGNMLIVNAASAGDQTVWQQTVSVIPNADYVFTYWLSSCYSTNLANIECSINGSAIDTQLAPSTTGEWIEVSYSWNSGASISATITLVDSTCIADGDDFAIDDISFCATMVYVDIDIKPGSYPNSINLKDQGVLPVAILGSSIDVSTIDLTKPITLGGTVVTSRGPAKAPKLAVSFEDVDGDGLMDLVAFFRVQDLVTSGALDETTTGLMLEAETTGGVPISGTDTVNIVPPE